MKRSLLLLLMIFLFSSYMYAQEDILRPKGRPEGDGYTYYSKSKVPIDIGFKFGFNLHQFSSDLTWSPELLNPTGLVFEQGSGISPYIALIVDVHLNKKMGIQFELGYESVFFNNNHTGQRSAYDYELDIWVLTEEKNEIEVSGAMIDLGLFFRYNLSKQLVIIGGPVVKIPTGNFTQDLHLELLDERFYYNDDVNTTELQYSGDIPVNTAFALDFGLAYKIELSKRLYILPQVSYQLMLNNIFDNSSVIDVSQMHITESILTQENSRLNAFRIVATLFYSL